ncbi:MAG TPA: SET domain-containing protein-lysine N-methyltransferase [Burkholderiaceae bacterium]|nr:SET domain-containing protein-lysine N-methyltransferase [Burkholderiaceae bacterium]
MTPTRSAKSPQKKPAKSPPKSPPKAPASTQGAPAASGTDKPAAGGRRIQVRRSGIHGKGVFALKPILKGETIIEYLGEVITWKQAQRQPPHNPDEPNHTFLFHLDDRHVIDGTRGGNAARWINHACVPNCEAEDNDGRIFIKALRNIRPGEELNFDYSLMIEERYTAKLKKDYECRCGARTCRGTMLAPKR